MCYSVTTWSSINGKTTIVAARIIPITPLGWLIGCLGVRNKQWISGWRTSRQLFPDDLRCSRSNTIGGSMIFVLVHQKNKSTTISRRSQVQNKHNRLTDWFFGGQAADTVDLWMKNKSTTISGRSQLQKNQCSPRHTHILTRTVTRWVTTLNNHG